LAAQRFNVPTENPAGLRRFGQLVLEKVPLLLLSAASSAITVYAQKAGGALNSTATISMRLRIENAIWSYALYVAKAMAEPPGDFPPSPRGFPAPVDGRRSGFGLDRRDDGRVALPKQEISRRRMVVVRSDTDPGDRDRAGGAAGWADRYAYIPFMGIFVSSVWLVSDLSLVCALHHTTLAAVALSPLAAYAWVSHAQIGYWSDSYTLFSHALEVTSRNGVAEANLGLTLLNAGRLDLAEPHLRAAIEFMPDVPTSYYDLGVILQRQGRLDEALREYKQALLCTGDPEAAARTHNNIGAILLTKNDLPAALAEYDAALRINPEEAHSLLGRGTIE
jgi:protein O-mannosyl-transferase